MHEISEQEIGMVELAITQIPSANVSILVTQMVSRKETRLRSTQMLWQEMKRLRTVVSCTKQEEVQQFINVVEVLWASTVSCSVMQMLSPMWSYEGCAPSHSLT